MDPCHTAPIGNKAEIHPSCDLENILMKIPHTLKIYTTMQGSHYTKLKWIMLQRYSAACFAHFN